MAKRVFGFGEIAIERTEGYVARPRQRTIETSPVPMRRYWVSASPKVIRGALAGNRYRTARGSERVTFDPDYPLATASGSVPTRPRQRAFESSPPFQAWCDLPKRKPALAGDRFQSSAFTDWLLVGRLHWPLVVQEASFQTTPWSTRTS